MSKTFVIAEAGVNHNGNLDTALKLADIAQEAGCNAVKFQVFWGLPKYEHLELSKDEFTKLKEYCDVIGIEFICTPDVLEAVDFLAELKMRKWKIGSAGTNNKELLRKIQTVNNKEMVIISSGMSNLIKIKKAIKILSINFNRSNIVVLHCVSQYPVLPEQANLKRIRELKLTADIRTGYSCHVISEINPLMNIVVPVIATTLGAIIIEKHLTLARQQIGPDHKASLEPNELKSMVKMIRQLENVY